MEFYFVLAAEEFNADHTQYDYVGSKLHTDIIAAHKEAKAHSRATGERTYVAKLVTRYKPGVTERKDY